MKAGLPERKEPVRTAVACGLMLGVEESRCGAMVFGGWVEGRDLMVTGLDLVFFQSRQEVRAFRDS